MASENDKAAGEGARPAQPWHAADEKRRRGQGAPVGTHSLTGGGGDVGMPAKPTAERGVERSEPRETPEPRRPDPMAEPRAGLGEILGRKP
ncbi:hypothetical protein [Ramlibacter sp.]|uniref:hypothetical protein n=1 Tax=Ramlibacter sp. TaxID=1917967 RepID=UPI002D604BEA|nr:hypothetical protein [Ramlibacter sp.]HYD77592.1 hypothetical protein [Ramlibacter sp.]